MCACSLEIQLYLGGGCIKGNMGSKLRQVTLIPLLEATRMLRELEHSPMEAGGESGGLFSPREGSGENFQYLKKTCRKARDPLSGY